MEYVGWKDAGSAMRHIEYADGYGRYRIEQALAQDASAAAARNDRPPPPGRAPWGSA